MSKRNFRSNPNFTKNIRVNTSLNRDQRGRLHEEGFKFAILSGALVLNDVLELPDDEIQIFVEKVMEFLKSVRHENEDIASLNEALKEKTGIDILLY